MHRYTIFFFLGSSIFLAIVGIYAYYQFTIHDGLYEEYFSDGKLHSAVNYKNGRPHGLAKTFFPNGQLKREANFLDGEQFGVTISYYENGNKKSEEYYEQSMLQRHGKFFNSDGSLQWEADFKDGLIIGGTRKEYKK